MKKLFCFLLVNLVTVLAWAQKPADDLVFVEGGVFKNTKSNYAGKNRVVPGFYLGKYEVTQKEWKAVMGSNPSKFEGDDLPVETVSWYDCVEYCNARSLKEGLKPYYTIEKDKKIRPIKPPLMT